MVDRQTIQLPAGEYSCLDSGQGDPVLFLHALAHYCWDDVYADSFGTNKPDRANVDDAFATLLWRGDGSLTAATNQDTCDVPVPLAVHLANRV